MLILKKIGEGNFVVIDDTEINEGIEFNYLDDTNTVRMSVCSDKSYWEVRKEYRKVLYSTEKHEYTIQLDLHDILKVISEVDKTEWNIKFNNDKLILL